MQHNLVAALMTRRVRTVAPDAPLSEALTIMAEERISSVVVAEDGRALGVLTERDAVRLLSRGERAQAHLCRDLMSSPVLTVPASADYREAYHLLSQRGVRHLVVGDHQNGFVGMLTESDIVRHLGVEYFMTLRDVGTVMSREVATLPPDVPLAEALTLMAVRRISCVVVMENARPVGMVTERDAVQFSLSGADPTAVLLRTVMTRPVRQTTESCYLHDAVREMETAGVRRLVVTDADGLLVGILTRRDIIKGLEGRYLQLLQETIEQQRQELAESRRALQDRDFADRIVNGAAEAAILVSDPEGCIIFANPAANPLLGVAAGTLLGRRLGEFHEAAGVALPDFAGLCRCLGEESGGRRLLVVPANGRYLEFSVSGLPDESGRLRALLFLGFDNTDRLLEDQALRQAQTTLRAVFDQAFQMAALLDPQGVVLDVNRTAQLTLDLPLDRALTRYYWQLPCFGDDPLQASRLQAMVKAAAAGETVKFEAYYRTPEGVRLADCRMRPLRDGAGRVTSLIAEGRDISDLRAVEENLRQSAAVFEQRIEYLAYHDSLTGLPNRALLRDRLNQALMQAERHGQQAALLSVDLDLFKQINDTLGYATGDELLIACSERLQEILRVSDTVARFGGDQFVVMLPGLHSSRATATAAQKILDGLRQPFVLGEKTLQITASIGISLFPDDGRDFDALLRNAEAAMQEAKRFGRDLYRFFDPAIDCRSHEQIHVHSRLRQAVDQGELVLHYQPQFDLTSGRLVGVEALVRWQDPERGLVMPRQFIPAAEESGLIVPVGAWVLREACRQAKAWQDAGLPPFTMAVNLSAIQFSRGNLVDSVKAALRDTGLEPRCLELELTESILIHETERVLDIVRELKSLGVQLSIDDFGTGYSSLAYLKRFAVDKVKIDRSFIRDLEVDADDAAIVRAVVQMSHSLRLKVIAEGVETERQLGLLKLLECDEVQGFHLGKPSHADELAPLLRH